MKQSMFVFAFCSVFVAGCMNTPPLTQATDGQESHVMIRDVVQRVKCELSEAFDEKTEQPEYRWLASWVAHADLTLTIADNVGLSPTGSFTQTLHSKLNRDVGPVGFAGGKPPAVGQSFVVSAGANLNGTATRNETLSFTVALDELKMWRRAQDRLEANIPPEYRICNFGTGTGVTGNLGLEEWVDAAFYPAEIHQLEAGIHPSGGSKQSSVSSPSSGKGKGASSAGGGEVKISDVLNDVQRWKPYLAAFDQELACPASSGSGSPGSNSAGGASIKAAGLTTGGKGSGKSSGSSSGSDRPACNKTAIVNANATLKDVDAAIKKAEKEVSQYQPVLASYLKNVYARVDRELDIAHSNAKVCNKDLADLLQKIGDGQQWIKQLTDALEDPKDNQGNKLTKTDPVEKVANWEPLLRNAYGSLFDLMENGDTFTKNVDPGTEANLPNVNKNPFIVHIARCGKSMQLAQNLPQQLPAQIDPPIDGISHSLTFLLNYNANISPTWNLIQWKGPGMSGNFFSAGAVRTHQLVIALSPRTANPLFTDEQNRLITLQAIQSIAGQ